MAMLAGAFRVSERNQRAGRFQCCPNALRFSTKELITIAIQDHVGQVIFSVTPARRCLVPAFDQRRSKNVVMPLALMVRQIQRAKQWMPNARTRCVNT